MKSTKFCECGGKQIEVSSATKVTIREATEAEKEQFEKSHWKWPQEPPCQTRMWQKLCEMLNSLKNYTFSVSSYEIWRECLKGLGQYQTGLGSLKDCYFRFVKTEEEPAQIRICVDYENKTEQKDYWGNPVKDSQGNIQYDTVCTSEVAVCQYPQDFWKLLDILRSFPKKKGVTIAFFPVQAIGNNNVLFKNDERYKGFIGRTGIYPQDKELKKNNERILSFFRANLWEINQFYTYVHARNQILGRKDYQQFCAAKQRILDVEGEIYFAFQNACGFDIDEKHAQLLALRAACEEEDRRALEERLALASAAVISEFDREGLLRRPKLSNREKRMEYEALRRFCKKYIPQLGEKNFQVESLHDRYPDLISEEDCLTFRKNWVRVARSYHGLTRGEEGEEAVFKVLRLYEDRMHILREYTWGKEHDFVVITPYGIFTIEVKNWRGPYVLTETGLLRRADGRGEPINLALQSKEHVETLRRNLKKYYNVLPQEIICSAEQNFTIKNEYKYLPVCYPNTVDKLLLPEGKKAVLSEAAMEEIERYLLDHKEAPYEFDVFLPWGEIDSRKAFLDSFARIAGGLAVAREEGR